MHSDVRPAQSTLFAVLDQPYKHWEADIRAEALDFLAGIDPLYFHYLAMQVEGALDDKERLKRAAAAARIGYFHGMETLFLLLGALLQAPHAPQAFMRKCANEHLRALVQRITDGAMLELMPYRLAQLSWESVSLLVHKQCDGGSGLAQLFGKFWARLSDEYLQPLHVAEYNSLKHGFRVGHGGVHLSTAEAPDGATVTDGDFASLGGSDFGTSFRQIFPAGGEDAANRSTTSALAVVNWSPATMIAALQLIAQSVNNIVSALRIANGAAVTSVQFVAPAHEGAFAKAWESAPTLDWLHWGPPVVEGARTTKEQLLDAWRAVRGGNDQPDASLEGGPSHQSPDECDARSNR